MFQESCTRGASRLVSYVVPVDAWWIGVGVRTRQGECYPHPGDDEMSASDTRQRIAHCALLSGFLSSRTVIVGGVSWVARVWATPEVQGETHTEYSSRVLFEKSTTPSGREKIQASRSGTVFCDELRYQHCWASVQRGIRSAGGGQVDGFCRLAGEADPQMKTVHFCQPPPR